MNHRLASFRLSRRIRRGCTWTAFGASLAACNGRLAVLDPPLQIGNAGAGGSLGDVGAAGSATQTLEGTAGTAGTQPSGSDAGPPPPEALPVVMDTTCDCGSSEQLLPLGCGSPSYSAGAPMISDDGETVAFDLCFNGSQERAVCRPFRWTRTGGVKSVPRAADGSTAAGLSADGDQVLLSPSLGVGVSAVVYRASDDTSVSTGLRPQPVVMGSDGSVVGISVVDAGSSRLVRWTRGAGLQVLGDVPFEANQLALWSTPSLAVVAGLPFGPSTTTTPFRWTEAGGLEPGLQGLPTIATAALSLSRDGSTLAGQLLGEANVLAPFAWTPNAGVVPLGVSAGRDFDTLSISADGSVITGSSDPTPTEPCGPVCSRVSAFRWTQPSGAVPLTPGVGSYATLMSEDGALVLGVATEGTLTPFYWTAEHGARDLLIELAAAGADVNGWELDAPVSLSPDGRVITGHGQCNGRSTIYRAVLPE